MRKAEDMAMSAVASVQIRYDANVMQCDECERFGALMQYRAGLGSMCLLMFYRAAALCKRATGED